MVITHCLSVLCLPKQKKQTNLMNQPQTPHADEGLFLPKDSNKKVVKSPQSKRICCCCQQTIQHLARIYYVHKGNIESYRKIFSNASLGVCCPQCYGKKYRNEHKAVAPKPKNIHPQENKIQKQHKQNSSRRYNNKKLTAKLEKQQGSNSLEPTKQPLPQEFIPQRELFHHINMMLNRPNSDLQFRSSPSSSAVPSERCASLPFVNPFRCGCCWNTIDSLKDRNYIHSENIKIFQSAFPHNLVSTGLCCVECWSTYCSFLIFQVSQHLDNNVQQSVCSFPSILPHLLMTQVDPTSYYSVPQENSYNVTDSTFVTPPPSCIPASISPSDLLGRFGLNNK